MRFRKIVHEIGSQEGILSDDVQQGFTAQTGFLLEGQIICLHQGTIWPEIPIRTIPTTHARGIQGPTIRLGIRGRHLDRIR